MEISNPYNIDHILNSTWSYKEDNENNTGDCWWYVWKILLMNGFKFDKPPQFTMNRKTDLAEPGTPSEEIWDVGDDGFTNTGYKIDAVRRESKKIREWIDKHFIEVDDINSHIFKPGDIVAVVDHQIDPINGILHLGTFITISIESWNIPNTHTFIVDLPGDKVGRPVDMLLIKDGNLPRDWTDIEDTHYRIFTPKEKL